MSKQNTGSGGSSRRGQRCAFCGRPPDANHKVIQGYGDACICSDCVKMCMTLMAEDDFGRRGDGMGISSAPTPRSLKRSMDEYVIGQDYAKKVLSVAVHNHYKRLLSGKGRDEVALEKSNVLIIGPSGCGKTLMAKILAETVDVP
ncbi:MAG: ATP-dependent Clp protease ATP-binding subunit ClpX, partial [Planctomycetota bacterium]|nr:ATP-dependent Clp protease ATP-binding subunit ClpX [Planctomycetota bacterium]